MLISDICDFSDAYIIVKGDISLTEAAGRNFVDLRKRFLAFKDNGPFTDCISKVNNVLVDNAEDLDVVMLEYSKNYRKTAGSLYNYYRDEPNNFPANNYNPNPITNSESLKHKTTITGKISNENQENGVNTEQANTMTKKNLETVVSLKHLSSFWRTLINCEIIVTLSQKMYFD